MVIAQVAVARDELAAHRAIFLANQVQKSQKCTIFGEKRTIICWFYLTFSLDTGRCSSCRIYADSCLLILVRNKFQCRFGKARNFLWSSQTGPQRPSPRPRCPWALEAWDWPQRSRLLHVKNLEYVQNNCSDYTTLCEASPQWEIKVWNPVKCFAATLTKYLLSKDFSAI